MQLALCLALKTLHLVWLEAYPPPIIMILGTVYMVALLVFLEAPAGLKEQRRGKKGIEQRMAREEKFPISRMKKTGNGFILMFAYINYISLVTVAHRFLFLLQLNIS